MLAMDNTGDLNTFCCPQKDKTLYGCTYAKYPDSERQKLKQELVGAWGRRIREFLLNR